MHRYYPYLMALFLSANVFAMHHENDENAREQFANAINASEFNVDLQIDNKSSQEIRIVTAGAGDHYLHQDKSICLPLRFNLQTFTMIKTPLIAIDSMATNPERIIASMILGATINKHDDLYELVVNRRLVQDRQLMRDEKQIYRGASFRIDLVIIDSSLDSQVTIRQRNITKSAHSCLPIRDNQ